MLGQKYGEKLQERTWSSSESVSEFLPKGRKVLTLGILVTEVLFEVPSTEASVFWSENETAGNTREYNSISRRINSNVLSGLG